MNFPTSFNFAGKITHNFIHNRPLTILILIVTVLVGFASYFATPKQYNPEVTLPAFQIQVDYPGATAEEVEQFVTRELEEKIADIPGVDKIYSMSSGGGRAIVNAEFFVGESLESAKVKIQSKLMENLDLKTGNIGTPLIKNITPDDVPILEIGFSSDSLAQNEVREKVIEVMNSLKQVSGVANLEVHGGERKALKILLDPDFMKIRNVSAWEVEQALKNSNMKVPAGAIKDGKYVREIEVNSSLSEENVKDIFVIPGVRIGDIATVQEAYAEKTSFVQVGRADSQSLLAPTPSSPNPFSQREKGNLLPSPSGRGAGGEGVTERFTDAVFLSIAKRKGENGITVAERARTKLEELAPELEKSGIHYTIFRDDGETAREEINRLGHDLMISIAIVVALLVVFLGFREASIVAIAIPLTLGLVFFMGYLFDQTINRITLFALILALGLLVDDAIVVVENIHRHLKQGDDKKTAIVRAVNEVGIGLFLCTFSAIVVFLPLTQITGMMGPYMGPLSFFVPMALAMSLFVAYVITPFLADLMIPQKTDHGIKHISLFDRIADWYANILAFILARKKLQKQILTWTFISFILALLIPAFALVHFKMLPKADRNQYYVYIDAEEGTDLPATQKIAQELSKIVLKDPATSSVEIFTGEAPVLDFNGLYKGANLRKAPNLASIRVNLNPDRKEKSEVVVENMRKNLIETWYFPRCNLKSTNENLSSELRSPPTRGLSSNSEALRLLPCDALHNTHLRLLEDPPGPPVSATLVAKIKGENREIREQIAREVEKRFAQTDAVVDIDTSIEHAVPKTIYTLDYDKALESGISTAQVASALSSALSPTNITTFHETGNKEMAFIEMSFPKESRDAVSDLSKIYVKNQMGQMVPLDSVVIKKESRSESVRMLDERQPTTTVSAEMGKRSVVYAVIDLISSLVNNPPDFNAKSSELSPRAGGDQNSGNSKHFTQSPSELLVLSSEFSLFDITYTLNNGEKYMVEWGGEWKMTLENFRDLGIAMIFAFFLVYVLLVAQFRSFSATALIMVTVPLALIGILFGFVLLDFFGIYLTATALIGFIALIGLVVKNGILFLEYYDYKITEGFSREQALTEAGRIRLQPIVLTSLTAILANLTIVTDSVWSGLAWAIVFGLSVSTVLSLLIFPILYNLVAPQR